MKWQWATVSGNLSSPPYPLCVASSLIAFYGWDGGFCDLPRGMSSVQNSKMSKSDVMYVLNWASKCIRLQSKYDWLKCGFMKDACQYFNFRFLLSHTLCMLWWSTFWFFSLLETTVDLITMNLKTYLFTSVIGSRVWFLMETFYQTCLGLRINFFLNYNLFYFLVSFPLIMFILVTSLSVGSYNLEIRSPSMLYPCRHKCDLT